MVGHLTGVQPWPYSNLLILFLSRCLDVYSKVIILLDTCLAWCQAPQDQVDFGNTSGLHMDALHEETEATSLFYAKLNFERMKVPLELLFTLTHLAFNCQIIIAYDLLSVPCAYLLACTSMVLNLSLPSFQYCKLVNLHVGPFSYMYPLMLMFRWILMFHVPTFSILDCL